MRTTTAAVNAALQGSNVPYLVFVELDFTDGVIRLCNTGYPFEWDGKTWIGSGNLGTISEIEEGKDLQMYGCVLTLTGLDSEVMASALGSGYSGRAATIWLAPLDEDFQVISDPVIIFKGKMDTMPIKLGKHAAIQLTIESKLVSWERPYNRRYNNEDQQSEYPNDKGLEFVAQMVEKEIYWGRSY